jgi:SAM-dependent methyltransferase
MRLARGAYDAVGLDREFPGKARLRAAVHRWEGGNKGAATPVTAETWDSQYREGTWAHLAGLRETSRYGAIVGYVTSLAPRGSILDVGCGEGVLFERLQPYGYDRYVGIDLSAVAVDALARHNSSRTAFVQANAESYRPTELFDIVVFNESLYYFRDPLGTLDRYLRCALKPDGKAIVSLYRAPRPSRAIAARIVDQGGVLSQTLVEQDGRAWSCIVVGREQ